MKISPLSSRVEICGRPSCFDINSAHAPECDSRQLFENPSIVGLNSQKLPAMRRSFTNLAGPCVLGPWLQV
jgi:hypothetical protein